MSKQMQPQQLQERKVQESHLFMSTEKEITPKLLKLLGEADVLINHYVVDAGGYHLHKTQQQRFVG